MGSDTPHPDAQGGGGKTLGTDVILVLSFLPPGFSQPQYKVAWLCSQCSGTEHVPLMSCQQWGLMFNSIHCFWPVAAYCNHCIMQLSGLHASTGSMHADSAAARQAVPPY